MSDISHNAIKRGMLYGGVLNGAVIVNHGSAKGYPDGDSILWKCHVTDLPDMIALLTAILQHQVGGR